VATSAYCLRVNVSDARGRRNDSLKFHVTWF
jgi:hypothetical protein